MDTKHFKILSSNQGFVPYRDGKDMAPTATL